MRDNYVSNVEEILSANQNQKDKIEYLQRECTMKNNYLSDLRQCLNLNKQIIIKLTDSENHQSIKKLLNQNTFLLQRLQKYYQQYQDINAVLLMERQLRLQSKSFYDERMIQFENKINDLRKYLHDKEDSFSHVVARLKKYEDAGELMLEDKLKNFKDQLKANYTVQFISQLMQERNKYKAQYEQALSEINIFNKIMSIIQNDEKYKQLLVLSKQFEKQKIKQKVTEASDKKKTISLPNLNPNKELIKLLKKQKLSNQILDEALNQAIEKNQQLIGYRDNLKKALDGLQIKYAMMRAQNAILALRLGQYDTHFCRNVSNCYNFYEEGEKKGLYKMTQRKIEEYCHLIKNNKQKMLEIKKLNTDQMKKDVEMWSQFIFEAAKIKKAKDNSLFLTKSCSQPQLLVDFQLQDFGEDLIIEEY